MALFTRVAMKRSPVLSRGVMLGIVTLTLYPGRAPRFRPAPRPEWLTAGYHPPLAVLLGGGARAGERLGKLGWLGALVVCTSLGLHNGARMAPVPLIEEFRLRYDVEYASVGAVI